MLYRRQKLLLQIIKKLSERKIRSKTYLVKTIFLLRQKFGFEKIGYDFFPYKYGPFSNQIYADLSYLESEGLLNENRLELTKNGIELINKIDNANEINSEAGRIVEEHPTTDAIKNFVYANFVEFTINSDSPRMEKGGPEKGVCSIGYEGKTLDGFLNELVKNKISILVDVRKNAMSMKKGFSKNSLSKHLADVNIRYIHFPELGIESEKRKELNSEEDYKELFKEYEASLPDKKEKITELESLGKKEKIALMCFEADKDFCHRGVLSDFLNHEVVHI
ncbi:MAG: DUF488 family protein [Candidatus Diapherotrites archaeon]|nr:DUF488 family protein [Candidatus Diapherotrites archaeon]